MKKTPIASVLLLLGLLFSSTVRADVLVLVHGYLGSAHDWDDSGITAVLGRHGWQRTGMYVAGPAGIQLIPAQGRKAVNKIYTVDLPSEAPVIVQAFQLRQVLASINTHHPDEPVILVGHSAGGVVARTALVRGEAGNIRALITIASPHLGTSRAEQALDATDIPFPLRLMADLFAGEVYDTARRSRSLYVDLVRPQPGTLLFWLNSEPHPDISYISIVRGQPAALTGDFVVPGYSQDMNNVAALRGRAATVTVNVSHGLDAVDGGVIVHLLASME